jgi:hypothetical protein
MLRLMWCRIFTGARDDFISFKNLKYHEVPFERYVMNFTYGIARKYCLRRHKVFDATLRV